MDVLVCSIFILVVLGVLQVVDSQGCQGNVTFTTRPSHFLKPHVLGLTDRGFLFWQIKGCTSAKMKMRRAGGSRWWIIHAADVNEPSVVKEDEQIIASTTKVYLRCDAFVELWLNWNEDDWSMGVGNVVGVDVIFTWSRTNLAFSDIIINSEHGSKLVWAFDNDGTYGKQATMLLTATNKKNPSSLSVLSTLLSDSAGDCAAFCFSSMSCSSFCFIPSQHKCELLSFILDLNELVDHLGANVYSLSPEGRIPYEE